MAGIKVIGLGKSRGERAVSNQDMEKIVDTSDQWIRSKSGIRSRYFAVEKSNVDMAVEAAETAILKSGIDRKEIGLCIVCTFSAEDRAPAVACSVAGRLGLSENLMAFDLNGACAGFIFGCNLANNFLSAENQKNRYALVIGSEKISPLINMEDRGSCVLFGDGAGAAVLQYEEDVDFVFTSGCSANREVLHCSGEEGKIKMSGQEVYRFAVSTVPRSINDLLIKAKKCEEDIDWFICHQANERIIDNVARRIGGDERKFFKNLYDYGNTSAASIPIAMCEMDEQNMLEKGSKIVCSGFGAGLTYGSMYITKG